MVVGEADSASESVGGGNRGGRTAGKSPHPSPSMVDTEPAHALAGRTVGVNCRSGPGWPGSSRAGTFAPHGPEILRAAGPPQSRGNPAEATPALGHRGAEAV